MRKSRVNGISNALVPVKNPLVAREKLGKLIKGSVQGSRIEPYHHEAKKTLPKLAGA